MSSILSATAVKPTQNATSRAEGTPDQAKKAKVVDLLVSAEPKAIYSPHVTNTLQAPPSSAAPTTRTASPWPRAFQRRSSRCSSPSTLRASNRKSPQTLVEVGCADGSTTAAMAQGMRQAGFENLDAHGIDIDFGYAKEALKTYAPKFASHPNLKFHWCAANEKWPCKADVVMMSSVLHEVESYTAPKDNRKAVPDFFAKLYKETDVGTIGVIRDFVAPTDGDKAAVVYHRESDVKTIVSKGADKTDEGKALTFPYLIERFKQSGRAGARAGFYCNEIDPRTQGLPLKPGFKAYLTNQKSAYRFVFGKDYFDMFTAEMNENYGFATEGRYKRMLKDAGFEVFFTERNPGDWIQDNRIDGKRRDLHAREQDLEAEQSFAVRLPNRDWASRRCRVSRSKAEACRWTKGRWHR